MYFAMNSMSVPGIWVCISFLISVWEYAEANLKSYPDAWDINHEAGIDWYYGLMKRNPDISLSMPEATSIARATGFNRQSVKLFFNHYNDIVFRPTFKLEPHRIWNLDESGVKTVADTTRVISQKKFKASRADILCRTWYTGNHVLLC